MKSIINIDYLEINCNQKELIEIKTRVFAGEKSEFEKITYPLLIPSVVREIGEKFSKKITVKPLKGGTNFYYNRSEIFVDEKKIFVVLHNPRPFTSQFKIDPKNVLIHVENECFYIKEMNKICMYLLDNNFHVNFISRVDYCTDFVYDIDLMNDYISILFKSPKMFSRNLHKVFATYDDTFHNTGVMSVRAGTSKVQRVYNKTKELLVRPKKYISDLHKEKFGEVEIQRIGNDIFYCYGTIRTKYINLFCKEIKKETKKSFYVSSNLSQNKTDLEISKLIEGCKTSKMFAGGNGFVNHYDDQYKSVDFYTQDIYRYEVQLSKAQLKTIVVDGELVNCHTGYKMFLNNPVLFFNRFSSLEFLKSQFKTYGYEKNFCIKGWYDVKESTGFVSARNTVSKLYDLFLIDRCAKVRETIKSVLRSVSDDQRRNLERYFSYKYGYFECNLYS